VYVTDRRIIMKRAAIITASDSGYRGEREDLSGPAIKEILEREGYEVISMDILPDDQVMLAGKLQEIADSEKAELILTTGGTGFSERDVTPEATEEVIERKVPGIPEAIRAYSMTITKRAMLSRATAGIRGKTLIVNLPGSPKAVRESLEYIIDALAHGLEILSGEARDCARK
jgi:molybdopterin adenylyltransferase